MNPRPLLPLALATCAVLAPLEAQTLSPDGDPRNGEVPLPARAGWNAFLVHDTGGPGIWTVKSMQVFERYGCPEIVGMDDEGRCTVLVSYSGKWTPNETVKDGRWLAPLAQVELAPGHDGPQLYTGGQSATLYQIVVDDEGELDGREIAHWADEEIHTLVGGALDPQRGGQQLLVFMRGGDVYEMLPEGDSGKFRSVLRAQLPGRVRDGVVLDAAPGEAPWIATVSRAQEVALVRLQGDGLERRVILREPMGFGRITRGVGEWSDVLYVTRDDGVILRLAPRSGSDEWERQVVYAGPQGLRGLVAGRFTGDPREECLACFGYSAKVQLLRRLPGEAWQAETLFVDGDRGHWLGRAEVDGRNGTDEIIASGYGGRIVLLARPPGYGLDAVVPTDPDVTIDPDGATHEAQPADDPDDTDEDGLPLRVATRAGDVAFDGLSPLNYQGGFETKTSVYETLVRRDATGRIVPALASAWRFLDDGRRVVFTLRDGATFHDGSPVTATAVATHFRRWVGLPEHDWLRSNRRIQRVVPRGARELEVVLDRPVALLPDLCAINPCAIQAPAALDREGAFRHPVGSGAWRVVSVDPAARVFRLQQHGEGRGTLDLLCLSKSEDADPLDALLRGNCDAVIGSWLVHIDPHRAVQLQLDQRFDVHTAPGSSVHYLSFALHEGPTAQLEVRRAVAAAIHREALCRTVHAGLADPCRTWAAPSAHGCWPRASLAPALAEPGSRLRLERPLRLLLAPGDAPELAHAVADQLLVAGVPVTIQRAADQDEWRTRVEALDFDLRLEHTWGVPYDPYLSLVARFATPVDGETAASPRAFGVDPGIRALVDQVVKTPEQDARRGLYVQIQRRIDGACLLLPLLAPRRIAVARKGLGAPAWDHDLYRSEFTGLLGGARPTVGAQEAAAAGSRSGA